MNAADIAIFLAGFGFGAGFGYVTHWVLADWRKLDNELTADQRDEYALPPGLPEKREMPEYVRRFNAGSEDGGAA